MVHEFLLTVAFPNVYSSSELRIPFRKPEKKDITEGTLGGPLMIR